MCPREKSWIFPPFAAEQSVLSSPVCLGIIAKYGHYSRISEEDEPNFSAVQTAWRRQRDSNPRYRSESCKLRCFCKLHGINKFRNSSADWVLPGRHAKQCAFAMSLGKNLTDSQGQTSQKPTSDRKAELIQGIGFPADKDLCVGLRVSRPLWESQLSPLRSPAKEKNE